MRISGWSSDVCSSDLLRHWNLEQGRHHFRGRQFTGVLLDRGIDVRRICHRPVGCGLAGARVLRRTGAVATATAGGKQPGRNKCQHCVRHGSRVGSSEEPTSELQTLMSIQYAVLCSKKNTQELTNITKKTTYKT